MAGLLGASALSRAALLPPCKGLQPEQQHHQRAAGASSSALLAALVACDATAVAAALATATAVTASVCLPPRTSSHTRRIVVPTYCLSGTRTRRSRSRRLGGGDEVAGGGDGGDGGWFGGNGDDGGSGWFGNGDDGSGDEDGGQGSSATRLQDLLVLWSLWCGLAFCQVLWHVSPKPKPAPAFAALSYPGLKAQLLRSSAPAACAAAI